MLNFEVLIKGNRHQFFFNCLKDKHKPINA